MWLLAIGIKAITVCCCRTIVERQRKEMCACSLPVPSWDKLNTWFKHQNVTKEIIHEAPFGVVPMKTFFFFNQPICLSHFIHVWIVNIYSIIKYYYFTLTHPLHGALITPLRSEHWFSCTVNVAIKYQPALYIANPGVKYIYCL